MSFVSSSVLKPLNRFQHAEFFLDRLMAERRPVDGLLLALRVRKSTEKVPNEGHSPATLIVEVHHSPRRMFRVSGFEHLFAGRGVVGIM